MRQWLSSAYRRHYKELFLLAYPISLSYVGQIATNMADTVMLGRVSSEALAVAGIGTNFYWLCFVFGMGFVFGLTPLVAAAAGAKDTSRVPQLLRSAVVLNTGVGVALCCILYLILSNIGFIRGASAGESSNEMIVSYTMIQMYSAVPWLLYFTLKQFAEGFSLTRRATIITLSANGLNIFLNYVLIYGNFGFEAMGTDGAAWATAISRVAMTVGMVVYVLKSNKLRPYVIEAFKVRISRDSIRELLKMGLPNGLQWSFEMWAFGIGIMIIDRFGELQVAAHQIALNVVSASFMLAFGIGAAATVRVGNFYGEKNYRELHRAAQTSRVMMVVFMAFSAAVIYTFNREIPWLIVDSGGPNAEQTALMASQLLIVAVGFQLSDGLQMVGMSILRGVQDVRLPTGIAVVAYWIIGLPAGAFMAYYYGMEVYGVWWGFTVGLTASAVLLFWRYRIQYKRFVREGFPDHPAGESAPEPQNVVV